MTENPFTLPTITPEALLTDEHKGFNKVRGIHGGMPWTRRNTCSARKAAKQAVGTKGERKLAARQLHYEKAMVPNMDTGKGLSFTKPGSLNPRAR